MEIHSTMLKALLDHFGDDFYMSGLYYDKLGILHCKIECEKDNVEVCIDVNFMYNKGKITVIENR